MIRHRPGLISPPPGVRTSSAASSSSCAVSQNQQNPQQQQRRASTPTASSKPASYASTAFSPAVRLDYVSSPPTAKQLVAAANEAAVNLAAKWRQTADSVRAQQEQKPREHNNEVQQQQQQQQQQLLDDRRFSRALELDLRGTAAPPQSLLQHSLKQQSHMLVPESRVQDRRHEQHLALYKQQFLEKSAALAVPNRDYDRMPLSLSNISNNTLTSNTSTTSSRVGQNQIASPVTKRIQEQSVVAELERQKLENRWLTQQLQLYVQRCTCGAARGGLAAPLAVDNREWPKEAAAPVSLFPTRPITTQQHQQQQQPSTATTTVGQASSSISQSSTSTAGASRALLADRTPVPAGRHMAPSVNTSLSGATTSRALLASFGGNARNLPASATMSFSSTNQSPRRGNNNSTMATPHHHHHHNRQYAPPSSSSSSPSSSFRLKMVNGCVVMVREDGALAVPLQHQRR